MAEVDYGLLNTGVKINTPFESLSQILQLRAQQENARGLAEQRQAIAEQRQQQLAKLAQDTADRTAAGQAIQQGGGVRDQTLAWARDKAPNTVPWLTEFFDKGDASANTIRSAKLKIANDEADFLGDIADAALKHGGTMEAAHTGLAYAVEQFPDYADAAQKIAAHIQDAPPEQVKSFLEQVRDSAPSRRVKPVAPPATVSPGQGVLNAAGTYDVPIPKEIDKPASAKEYEYAQSQGFKGTFDQYQTQDANRRRPVTNMSMGGPGGGLEPDAVDYTATQYRILGPSGIPTRIEAADRVKILNTAARQAKALGQSPAQAVQKQAAFKSDGASLTRMSTMKSSAEAFETKANAQADLVKNLSEKVGRTSMPLVNEALVSGKVKLGGDENTQLFVNALTTFTAEYAKIMEGSTGSAQGSSDAARKAAADLVRAGLNKGQLRKTVEQMQWEMRQTIQGYDATIDHITSRMGGAQAPAIAPKPAPVGETPEARFKRIQGGG